MNTIHDLLKLLIEYGGEIVIANSLRQQWLNQAKASNRTCIENEVEFVWEPKIMKFPENEEELLFMERWYPLPIELSEELKDPDKFFKMIEQGDLEDKQKKLN